MIGYVTLGANDLPRAVKFYDALFAEMGANKMFENEEFVAWSGPNNSPGIGITKPHNKQPATVGNGVMVAYEVSSPVEVDRLYAKAIELGASDEGAPGQRSDWFYAGYWRDLDGNKANFFWMKTPD
jgi:predicted lactoylglutathione lyase